VSLQNLGTEREKKITRKEGKNEKKIKRKKGKKGKK
jgi:hypothetical protein